MPLAPTAAASEAQAKDAAARAAEARAEADRAFDADLALKNEMADILVEYIDNGCTGDDLRGRGYSEAEVLRCGPAAAAIARRHAQRRAA